MIKNFFKWLKDTFGDTWLIRTLDKIIFSLDNSKRGFSGKKLTALTLTYCIAKMHEYYISYAFLNKDFSLMPVILASDFGFLTLLFGLNEYSKKRLDGDNKNNNQNEQNQNQNEQNLNN